MDPLTTDTEDLPNDNRRKSGMPFPAALELAGRASRLQSAIGLECRAADGQILITDKRLPVPYQLVQNVAQPVEWALFVSLYKLEPEERDWARALALEVVHGMRIVKLMLSEDLHLVCSYEMTVASEEDFTALYHIAASTIREATKRFTTAMSDHKKQTQNQM